MSASSSLPEGASADAAFAAWFTSVFEPVAVGVLHSLGNRMCALESIAALPAAARAAPAGRLTDVQMRAEIAQAIELQRVLRGMFPDTLPAEALDLRDVAAEAVRLVEHHPAARRARSGLRVTGEAAPARLPRWALRRIFLTLAALCARPGGVEFCIAPGEDEHVVHVRSGGDELIAPAAPGFAYTVRLARDIGVRIEPDGPGYRVSVTSLAAVRRRERAVSASG